MKGQVNRLIRDVAWVRWLALIFLALMMFFAYMFVDVLSPLMSMLEDQLGWSSTVYGTESSSEYFLNVFVGFLILAGIILDRMGIRFTVVLSGSLMVIGAAIRYYAISPYFAGTGLESLLSGWWESMPASAKLSSLGFAIFGCGVEMAGITVSKAIVKWFQGKELALAMGVEMAIARLGVAVVMVLSPRIAEHFSDIGVSAPVLFCLALLVIGFLCFLGYVVLDARLDKQMGEFEMEAEPPFRFSDMGKLLTNRAFWVIALLCVLYYSSIFPFQKYAINMLENNLSMSPSEAGEIFFWFPIGAAIITPFLGSFLDKRGKGASMLMLGAVLMFVCHLTFAVVPLNVPIALAAIVLLGVSFSLVPASLWPSVPKLVPNSYLGTAYALIFWIQNIGLFAVPIVVGRVLDVTNPGKSATDLNYTPVMLIFASLGVIAFILGYYLRELDKKRNYGLEAPNIAS